MGSVFVAERRGARVALKALVTPEQHAAELRARFLREIDVCANLAHENLVPILDHGVDREHGVSYFVMPLLHGQDLGTRLGRTGAIEPEVAVRIVIEAIRGVRAVHAAGIIHRDLKPSNLFLDEGQGGSVVVKVADFGLAKVRGAIDGLTISGAGMGTPQYMSPEQSASAKHVDERSDVYSLGMVLYHALAGAPAFARAGSFMAFVVGASGPHVPAIQELAPWIDPRLARAVHAALLRAPEARWPNALELELGLTMAVGYDASEAPLLSSRIAPVSAATRAISAPKAALPGSWEDLLRG